jgi:hypothetical protein
MEPDAAELGADGRGLDDPDDGGQGGGLRFLVTLILLVGLMLLLMAAVHPSGVEGCGGG